MADLKLVINDTKTGKSYQKVLVNSQFLGKKIKDNVKGESIGLTGYELEITGGSDKAGVPLRYDLHGSGRKALLIGKSTGLQKIAKNARRRKTLHGNTVADDIAQLNLKITKYGNKDLRELLGVKEEPKEEKKKAKEEKKEEVKVEEKKGEPKKEETKEAPKQEVKDETKAESIKK